MKIPITLQSQERREDSIQATRAYKDRNLKNKYYSVMTGRVYQRRAKKKSEQDAGKSG